MACSGYTTCVACYPHQGELNMIRKSKYSNLLNVIYISMLVSSYDITKLNFDSMYIKNNEADSW